MELTVREQVTLRLMAKVFEDQVRNNTLAALEYNYGESPTPLSPLEIEGLLNKLRGIAQPAVPENLLVVLVRCGYVERILASDPNLVPKVVDYDELYAQHGKNPTLPLDYQNLHRVL